MRQSIVMSLMLLILSAAHGQNRDSIAAMVMRAPIAHAAHTSTGGVSLRLRGVYIRDGLLWCAFDAQTRSSVDFRGDVMRFWLQPGHTVRRQAQQELRWLAVYGNSPVVLRSNSSATFCYAVPARAPSRRQLLRVEWVERNGDRRLWLYIPAKRMVGARKLPAGARKS